RSLRRRLGSPLFPYTTLFRSLLGADFAGVVGPERWAADQRFPAERPPLGSASLKRDFQGLVDRGGEAEPVGRWGLAKIERLVVRSEEHTSELQSRGHLVCRLL